MVCKTFGKKARIKFHGKNGPNLPKFEEFIYFSNRHIFILSSKRQPIIEKDFIILLFIYLFFIIISMSSMQPNLGKASELIWLHARYEGDYRRLSPNPDQMIAASALLYIAKLKTKKPQNPTTTLMEGIMENNNCISSAPWDLHLLLLLQRQLCILLISATKQNKTNKQTNKQSLRKAPDVGDLNLQLHSLACVCVCVCVCVVCMCLCAAWYILQFMMMTMMQESWVSLLCTPYSATSSSSSSSNDKQQQILDLHHPVYQCSNFYKWVVQAGCESLVEPPTFLLCLFSRSRVQCFKNH